MDNNSHLKNSIDLIANQLPGYFLLKDMDSTYVSGCLKTAKLFGFTQADDLVGITDYEIKCEAANYADLFVQQDDEVRGTQKTIHVLDVHPYVDGEIKILLINKSILKDENNNSVGISCYCVELDNTSLSKIALQLSQSNLAVIKNKRIKKAANYYIGSEYPELQLSKRQAECLFYLIRGKSVRAIALILQLSPRTVETYIEQIKCKTKCATKAEIIELAIEKGYADIIPPGVICDKFVEVLAG